MTESTKMYKLVQTIAGNTVTTPEPLGVQCGTQCPQSGGRRSRRQSRGSRRSRRSRRQSRGSRGSRRSRRQSRRQSRGSRRSRKSRRGSQARGVSSWLKQAGSLIQAIMKLEGLPDYVKDGAPMKKVVAQILKEHDRDVESAARSLTTASVVKRFDQAVREIKAKRESKL